MSDWNDACYDFYDCAIAQGMTHEEAEKALDDKIRNLLKLHPKLTKAAFDFMTNKVEVTDEH